MSTKVIGLHVEFLVIRLLSIKMQNLIKKISAIAKEKHVLVFVNTAEEESVIKCAELIFEGVENIVKTLLTSYEAITKYDTFICVRKLISSPIMMKKPGYEIFVVKMEN